MDIKRRMDLRGVNFGPISVASGTLNNFGEGWPYHKILKRMTSDFDFTGATLVSKTATLLARDGNMPLDEKFQPSEWFPKCIYTNHFQQIAVNAVSLSNPGIMALLATGEWQKLTKPFFISLMPMSIDDSTERERLAETENLARILSRNVSPSKTSFVFGIQLNISCPNLDHDPVKLANEALGQGHILRSTLGGEIPIDLKINAMTPLKMIKLIQEADVFDSLTCSNTIPWGKMPDVINWRKISRDGKSPLQKRGFKQSGGLSGRPLLPIVEKWIHEARAYGIHMHITAGGGILCPNDINRLHLVGADAFAIGSVAFLNPFNVRPIIHRAYSVKGGEPC